jgi:hypothetical protein
MVGWQNHRAWFQKNDYHKIKIICINRKFACFFISIDSVSKSLIIFQKNKQKSQWVAWHVKEMKINEKNENQKLSNLECVAKTIRNGYFCCFQCQLGLVNTQSKLI